MQKIKSQIPFFSQNKRFIIMGIAIFITITFFASLPESVFAFTEQTKASQSSALDTVLDFFRGVGSPIDFALYSILVVMGWIVNLAAILMGSLVDVTLFDRIFRESEILKQGWFFVRDFFNIFFILILLFSAFATIFQVEKFHLKRTLLMIILMALLVNFSWPIARVIIDAGNIVMYFFMQNLFENPSGTGILASISSKSGIAGTFVPQTFEQANAPKWAASELIFRIIFVFLYAITLMTIAGIYLIRLVMLSILIIFAPIGFVAAIFPSTQKFASMWWENIFKWSFIGAIMMFMLALSLKLMTAFNTGEGKRMLYANKEAYFDVSTLLVTGIQMATAIVILWAGIIAAGKIGGGAASAVTNKASSAGKWGTTLLPRLFGRYGKWQTGVALRATDRALARKEFKVPKKLQKVVGAETVNASPRALLRGLKEHSERVEEQALSLGAGSWHTALNKFWRDTDGTEYRTLAFERQIATEAKKYSEFTEDFGFNLGELNKLKGKKGADVSAKLLGLLHNIYNQNDQDELAIRYFGHPTNSPHERNKAVEKLLLDSGLDKQTAYKSMADLNLLSMSKGNGDYGSVYWDDATSHYKMADNANDQAKRYAIKWKSSGAPQAAVRLMHRNAMFIEDGDGKVAGAGIHASGKAWLQKVLDGNVLNRVKEHRSDYLSQAVSKEGQAALERIALQTETEVGTEQAKMIRTYAQALKKHAETGSI